MTKDAPPTGFDEEREIVASAGTFTLRLVPNEARFFDQREAIPAHKSVLRPLCAWAKEGWVYQLEPTSEAYRAAGDILKREKGKFRIDLSNDPITGREFFWNASGGMRGTIVLLGRREQVDWSAIFDASDNVWVFDNFLTGHSAAAIRMARAAVKASDLVAFCLPRNNGIEWMDVYAQPEFAVRMFDAARTLVPQRPIDE